MGRERKGVHSPLMTTSSVVPWFTISNDPVPWLLNSQFREFNPLTIMDVGGEVGVTA